MATQENVISSSDSATNIAFYNGKCTYGDLMPIMCNEISSSDNPNISFGNHKSVYSENFTVDYDSDSSSNYDSSSDTN